MSGDDGRRGTKRRHSADSPNNFVAFGQPDKKERRIQQSPHPSILSAEVSLDGFSTKSSVTAGSSAGKSGGSKGISKKSNENKKEEQTAAEAEEDDLLDLLRRPLRPYAQKTDLEDWIDVYPFRAFLVQLELEEEDQYTLSPNIETHLKRVAYTTLDYSVKNIFTATEENFTVKIFEPKIQHCYQVDDFKRLIGAEGIQLDYSLDFFGDDDGWNDLFKYMSNRKYVLRHGVFLYANLKKGDLPEKIQHLKRMYRILSNVLRGGMSNGRAKKLWDTLIEEHMVPKIIKRTGVYELETYTPSHDATDTSVQLVGNQKFFHDFSVKVVPRKKYNDDNDYIKCGKNNVCYAPHKFEADNVAFRTDIPGHISLSIENKKDRDSRKDALKQCTLQIISQSHFKKHTIGIVTVNSSYAIVCISKRNDGRLILNRLDWQHMEMFAEINGHEFSTINFEKMKELFNWVYRILMFDANFKPSRSGKRT